MLGPVMLGLEGLALGAEERELLSHPLTGGVILFSRNYHSPEQLLALTTAIRAQRAELLIAVDHEGGRVQRFRDGFSALPPVRVWGEVYDRDRALGCQLARTHGWLLAAELRAVGVDFSFTPVLDVDSGVSRVIGDRAFHTDPKAVTALASAHIQGLADAGMAAIGKHYPGHGSVAADSHTELPHDNRPLAAIENNDLRPFVALIAANIAAVMPSLVVYTQVDRRPACFSPIWLRQILRQKMGFSGAVLSDDLGMTGAAFAGDALARAEAALAAGCDMVLACNERAAAVAMLDGLSYGGRHVADPAPRLVALRASKTVRAQEPGLTGLQAQPLWQQARARLQEYLLTDSPGN